MSVPSNLRPRRLPNEINSNVPLASRNRLLQEENVLAIVDVISKRVGRSLDELEIKGVMSHIRRLDGVKFAAMPIDQAVEHVAAGYLNYVGMRNDSIIDVHETMKQYIGGGVPVSPDRFTIKKNAGAVNGMPNDRGEVQHVGEYAGSYAQWPRVDGFARGMGRSGDGLRGITVAVPSPGMNTPTTPSQTLPLGMQRAENGDLVIIATAPDDAGVPVHGSFIKKNNITRSRKKYMGMLLDSRYRALRNAASDYTWSISDQPSDTPGSVSTQAGMSNILSMKFSEFFIPYVPEADNPAKKITVLIDTLSMSSVMAHENRHYHVICDTSIVTNRIRLVPENCGVFKFNEPIDHLKRISISFANPLVQLNFLPDTYSVTLSVNAPNSTYISFLTKHYVSDGELILITGFTTANPSSDFAAIAAVNNPNGVVVSVVDDYTLEITQDLSTSTLLTDPPSTFAYISSRRIMIPIEFTYM